MCSATKTSPVPLSFPLKPGRDGEKINPPVNPVASPGVVHGPAAKGAKAVPPLPVKLKLKVHQQRRKRKEVVNPAPVKAAIENARNVAAGRRTNPETTKARKKTPASQKPRTPTAVTRAPAGRNGRPGARRSRNSAKSIPEALLPHYNHCLHRGRGNSRILVRHPKNLTFQRPKVSFLLFN